MGRFVSYRARAATLAVATALIAAATIAPPAAAAPSAAPDLHVRAEIGAPWIRAGTSVDVAITVTNRGSAAATRVVVTPQLEALLSIEALVAPTGVCDLLVPVCDLGSIAPGRAERVRFTASADDEGSVTVGAAASGDSPDGDPDDNVIERVLRIGAADERCTMRGTSGRDRIRGTPGKDVICALAGRDVVRSLGGADEIFGGKGKDRLLGGRHGDRLRGGPAADRLRGGPGRDRLSGGPGRDDVAGGPGRDRCPGERGRSC